MAVTPPPRAVRAVGAFNPTPGRPGFLQPLLAAADGTDNRTFVQALIEPGRIAGFVPVGWPDRDVMPLPDEPRLRMDGPSLWAFHLPGEPVVSAGWTPFREIMSTLLDHGAIARMPLLLFDIVDTLDLDEPRSRVYADAFRAFEKMDAGSALRWRDRAILEPALASVLADPDMDVLEDHRAGEGDDGRLRARIGRRGVDVRVSGDFDDDARLRLQRRYDELAKRHPELFRKDLRINVAERPAATRSKPSEPEADIVVVLARRSGLFGRRRVSERDKSVEIVDIDRWGGSPSSTDIVPTLIAGTPRDMPELVEAAARVPIGTAIIVVMSSSSTPRMGGYGEAFRSGIPTIAVAAPFAPSGFTANGLPTALRQVVAILVSQPELPGWLADRADVGEAGWLLLRDGTRGDADPIGSACRLAARAFAAGAAVGGLARLYEGADEEDPGHSVRRALSKVFEVGRSAVRASIPSGRALLTPRAAGPPGDRLGAEAVRGIRDVLRMRGWRVLDDHDGDRFEMEDDARRFQVRVLTRDDVPPAEDPNRDGPALGRARLLVIHTRGGRQALLDGNCGQHFHVSFEDVPLIRPATDWTWPVLRRQLLGPGAKPSGAALRLLARCASAAIEAGRVVDGDFDRERIASLLSRPDVQRFVRFDEPAMASGSAWLIVRAGSDADRISLRVIIDDEGPLVFAHEYRRR